MASKKMSKLETLQAIKNYMGELHKQDCKGSTGSNGKAAEVAVRALVNGGRLWSSDIRARQERRDDLKIKVDGEWVRIEVKTGAGALQYGGEYEHISEVDINALLPEVDYIAYNPEVAHNMEIGEQFFVATREQFIEMLTGYNPNKPYTMLKLSKGGRQVNLQEFKTSKKKTDYLFDWLYELPSLNEWLENMGR